jgi:hypothetical protein
LIQLVPDNNRQGNSLESSLLIPMKIPRLKIVNQYKK